MSTVDLVVDVDRADRATGSVAGPVTGSVTAPGTCAVRERHVLSERTVYVAVAGAGGLTTRSCGLREWRNELENVCRQSGRETPRSAVRDEPELPWELLVATGRALAEHRHDVYDQLVARAAPDLRPVLLRLHQETLGRLRVVGTLPTRRRVGWVSWVLLPDGWQGLTPYVARTAGTSRPMVHLAPRGPRDLVQEVARWTAEARR